MKKSSSMIARRLFLKSSLVAGVSCLTWDQLLPAAKTQAAYRHTLDVAAKLFDGKKCWCHPRAGIVPGAGNGGLPRVVMTMNTLDLSGSDIFKGMYSLQTDDLGQSWSEPQMMETLAPRFETINGQERPVAISDFWPTWHAASKTLLGTGHTVVYTPDWRVRNPRPRHTSYSTYEPKTSSWNSWKKMEMPKDAKFENSGAGCTQRVDLEDGNLLLPIYFLPKGKNSGVTVARCSFDGETLRYLEHGSELHIDDKTRGLHEPSLTRFGDNYYLTIRNDKRGFVTRSQDGLNFEPIQTWKFDDGRDLGNYNTQQHWVTHSDALYLVYTRRGADNDHVFRHRAPLFIAQVDPQTLRVIRATEQVLVPERGARLGNFGVTHVSPEETWVTVSEWMQTWGPDHIMKVGNKYGSDGSVFVARIHWARPNQNF